MRLRLSRFLLSALARLRATVEWMVSYRTLVVPVVLTMACGLTACRRSEAPPKPSPATTESPASAPPTQRVVGPLTEDEARALATMNDRIRDYLALHEKIEATLPRLPDKATPQQIDTNQRLFEKKMREARANAKPGNLFTPEARPVILKLLAAVFAGPEGKKLKASIMDENPVDVPHGVNARYPDTVPLSTVPPDVLQTMPKLTEDLEYRFIGDDLILLDTHAHIIVDFVEDALPK
jgi:hypothetical protein